MLEKINKPNDIHKIALADFPQLAEEIRQFLIESVSQTGGHLASNLGAVALTLALHNVLELPQDKIVWDVGHQAYTHKILTGRKEGFKTLRKEGGMSGFPSEARVTVMHLMQDTVRTLSQQVWDMCGQGIFWDRITVWSQ